VAQGTPNTVVYRCPGNPVLYTDALSANEARAKGCTAIESAPVTIVEGARPRASAPAPPAARTAQQRVDPADQRARDSDARRILTEELRREETQLAEIEREYNGGQPERRGDERNYQRYLDRVASLKAALERKEADIAAIKRELAKLPP
jgi:chromosome segregation ATPase